MPNVAPLDETSRIELLEAEIERLNRIRRVQRESIGGMGGTVQDLREKLGISLAELSKRSGLTPPLLTQIETAPDANPKLKTLDKLAVGLGIKTSELIATYETRPATKESARLHFKAIRKMLKEGK